MFFYTFLLLHFYGFKETHQERYKYEFNEYMDKASLVRVMGYGVERKGDRERERKERERERQRERETAREREGERQREAEREGEREGEGRNELGRGEKFDFSFTLSKVPDVAATSLGFDRSRNAFHLSIRCNPLKKSFQTVFESKPFADFSQGRNLVVLAMLEAAVT